MEASEEQAREPEADASPEAVFVLGAPGAGSPLLARALASLAGTSSWDPTLGAALGTTADQGERLTAADSAEVTGAARRARVS